MVLSNDQKIIIVTRKTRLEDLLVRYNTIAQAKFYIEHLGADFSDYENEHKQYQLAIQDLKDIVAEFGRMQILERTFLSNFIFGDNDIVIALGQDGLVANTMKYLNGQLLIGVNPDPFRFDGILLPFVVKDLKLILRDVLFRRRKAKNVTMAKVMLSDGQKLYAVNDFFIGMKTHVSSRYELSIDNLTEQQSSSGVIVSTGMGSTGWYKSYISGAIGVTNQLLGWKIKLNKINSFGWDSDYLRFFVREPFPSKTSAINLIFGKVTKEHPLMIISKNPENGVIFSDGIEADFLQFNSGMQATVSIADKVGNLVI